MDAVVTQRDQTPDRTTMTITVEWLLFLSLLSFSLLFRLVGLGGPALTVDEVEPALAAWRVVSPDAPGSPIVADSVMAFWTNTIGMSLMGGQAVAVRLVTALGGVLLSLSPFLFRDLLGPARTFVTSLFLVLSPVLLGASRFSSPVVWSLLFALIGLWAVYRWWSFGRDRAHALTASIAFAALIFLAEPAGILLAILLLIAGVIAVSITMMDVDMDLPGDDYLDDLRSAWRGWPWSAGLMFAGLMVFVVATGFMLYPDGLAIIGAGLQAFLDGLRTSSPSAPALFPLTVTLFYETFLVLTAAIAVAALIWLRQVTFIERFLMAWVGLAVIAAVIYPGAVAAHALWFVIPLAALASYAVVISLETVALPVIWLPDLLDDEEQRTAQAVWGKWLIATVTLVLFLAVGTHFQIMSRGFYIANAGDLGDFIARLNTANFETYTISLVWFLISLLLILVSYFLASSIWGSVVPAQGLLLGMVAFGLLTSFGSGLNLVGERANDPAEVWFTEGTSEEAALMREVLLDLSFRETENFPLLPVAVVGPDDDMVAWEVRDFPNTTFVASVDDAYGAEIVIAPLDLIQLPDDPTSYRELPLGADYVGQDFEITSVWQSGWLRGLQFLPWWSDRLTTVQPFIVGENVILPQSGQSVVVWVRQDIYDSNPFNFEDLRP
jgi:hypothetical protein